jgi:dTDP-4-amino-4,6-dideoxygalactose transaminase
MNDNPERILVTSPLLPELDDFVPYLEKIWQSKWLTNNGAYHEELERALRDYLGVTHLNLIANGTLALVIALQALRISGEVITTPYSFVATTHSLWWNNIKPVFVDIEPETFNIDPDRIEAAITPKTTAIMPVHVYGNPCDMERIQAIADTYGLRIIYDAAHAFGVKKDGVSLMNAGDLSVLSFHATKVYSTIEGGAIVCHDEKLKKRVDYLKNFGFSDETTVVAPGINAKMNEIQAAFGLLSLKAVDQAIARRKEIAGMYREGLKDVEGIRVIPPPSARCGTELRAFPHSRRRPEVRHETRRSLQKIERTQYLWTPIFLSPDQQFSDLPQFAFSQTRQSSSSQPCRLAGHLSADTPWTERGRCDTNPGLYKRKGMRA